MYKWLHCRDKNTRGFTLAEIIVVIGIISLMSSVAFATVSRVRSKTRDIQRANDMKTIMTALKLYRNDNGHYPCAEWELESSNPNFLSELVDGGYISAVPHDPINDDGHIYYYITTSNVPGGDCGMDFMMSYDIEYAGTECSLGGHFITGTHCHVSSPDGLPCSDPWLYDESMSSSDCGAIRDDE